MDTYVGILTHSIDHRDNCQRKLFSPFEVENWMEGSYYLLSVDKIIDKYIS